MKLYRFTASTTQKAIMAVHTSLGDDALIYSTRKIPDGIEVLAGMPVETNAEKSAGSSASKKNGIVKKPSRSKVKIEDTLLDQKAMEALKMQVQSMTENLRVLSENISKVHQLIQVELVNKKSNRWNIFKGLKKINFKAGIYGNKSIIKS